LQPFLDSLCLTLFASPKSKTQDSLKNWGDDFASPVRILLHSGNKRPMVER